MRLSDIIDIRKFAYKWDVIENISEFSVLKECRQSNKWHKEGTAWEHTKKVCEAAVKMCEEMGWENETRWASFLLGSALFHDIGKGVTTNFFKGDWHSYNHENAGEKLTRRILWDTDPEIREGICAMVRYHMLPLRMLDSKDYLERITAMSKTLFPSSWYLLLLLKKCDLLGSVQEDETSQERDFQILKDLEMLTSRLGCYYTPSSIPNKSHFRSVSFGKPRITVNVMVGVSGAGKSTVIKSIAPKYRKPYTIISRDAVREELGLCEKDEKTVGTAEEEEEVSRICNENALIAAEKGDIIFFDNMNLRRKYRDDYKELLTDYDVEWNYHYVEAPSLGENVKRRNYPPEILESMISKIEWPSGEEYDKIFFYVTDTVS